jgi:hypothetical protein
MTIPGLRLEIVGAGSRRGSRATDRLEVDAADLQPGTAPIEGDPMAVGARFLGLGWATVDADRVAAGWTGARWTAAPRDSLVGARALLGRLDADGPDATDPEPASRGPTVTTVLLEPDTEGRLAAVLARHGEGPAALYVSAPDAAVARARARLAGLGARVSVGWGPFGPGIAIVGTPAWSPTLILVPARGTIWA